jgi:hypothetical protein
MVMPDAARDVVAHAGQPRARQQDRDAHLRALDDHLRGQAPGRVEHLVGAVDGLEPHPAGDRVDRVVAADVLDEAQDLRAAPSVGCVQSAQPWTAPATL